MKDEMKKTQLLGGASAREFKAAALDSLVKREQETKRTQLATKMAGLKALRLARDAAALTEIAPKAPKTSKAPKSKSTAPKE